MPLRSRDMRRSRAQFWVDLSLISAPLVHLRSNRDSKATNPIHDLKSPDAAVLERGGDSRAQTAPRSTHTRGHGANFRSQLDFEGLALRD